MTILNIETGLKNKVLRQKSQKIARIDKKIIQLVEEMKETMVSSKGVGLAAPQISQNIRLFVMIFDSQNKKDLDSLREKEKEQDENFREKEKKRMKFLTCINPEIIEYSPNLIEFEEGCLSLPNQFALVQRPQEIVMKFLDEKSRKQKLRLRGLNAIVAQHECDHLEGVLFLDLHKGDKLQ